MFSFIAMAADAATTDTTGSMVSTLITFAIIILIFYFLLIRPQKKRDQEARDMINAIKKGDKVVTIGGIRGTVAIVKENTVVIKVDDNARIEFNKTAISQVLDKKPASEDPKKKGKKTEELEVVEKPEIAEDAKAAEEAPAEKEEEKSEDK